MCILSDYIEEQRALDARRAKEIHQIEISMQEILMCIKGNPDMNIDGMAPTQRRLEQELSLVKENLSMVTQTTSDIEKKMKSFEDLRKTFEMLSNRSIQKILLKIVLIFCGVSVLLKLGATKLFLFVKDFFELFN